MANPADLYKSALRRSFTRLVEDLDPQPILDRFIEIGFLPYTVIRDIQETGRTSDKNRTIIEKVMSKGPDGYTTFKKCLNDTHQGHLADHLTGAENKIKQEESKKPRAATRVGGQTGPRASSPYPVVATQPVSHQYSNQPLPRYQQPVRPKSTFAQPIQSIQTKGQPTQHIQTKGQPIQHIPMEGRPTQYIQTEGQPTQRIHAVGQPIQYISMEGQPTQPIPTREHQYPIYTGMRETEFLSEKRLLALSKEIGTEWYSLAINLNLTNASIEQIMSNNPNNITLQIVTILVRWRNNHNTQNPSSMMQELAAALEEVGRRDLAQKVKKQYQDWLRKGKEKLSDMQVNTMVSDTEPLSYAASMTDVSKRKRDSDQSYTNTEENIVTPDNQPASSNAALGKTCIQDPSSSLAQHGQVDFSRLASTNYGEQLSASIQDAPSTSGHGQHLASGQDQQTRRNLGQSLTSGYGQQTINSQGQPPVINQDQHTAYDSTSMVSNIVQETAPSPVQQLSQLTLTDDNSQSHNHGTGPGQLATSGQSQVQANPYGQLPASSQVQLPVESQYPSTTSSQTPRIDQFQQTISGQGHSSGQSRYPASGQGQHTTSDRSQAPGSGQDQHTTSDWSQAPASGLGQPPANRQYQHTPSDRSQAPASGQGQHTPSDWSQAPASGLGQPPANRQYQHTQSDRSQAPASGQGQHTPSDRSQAPASGQGQHTPSDRSQAPASGQGQHTTSDWSQAPASGLGQPPANRQYQHTQSDRSQAPASGQGQHTPSDLSQAPASGQGQHTTSDRRQAPASGQGQHTPSDRSQAPASGQGQHTTSDRSPAPASGHGQPTMSNPNLESAQSHNTAYNYNRNNNTQMTAQPTQHPGMSIDLDNPDHDSVDAMRIQYSGIQTGTKNVPEIQTTTEPMHQAIHNIESELEKIKVMNSHRNPTDLPPTVPLVNDNAAQPTEVDAFVKKTETTTGVNTSSSASTVTVLDSKKIPGITRSIDVNACPHDGRIWHLDLEHVKSDLKKKLPFNNGGYGTIYKGKSSNLDMQVVFKKIEYKGAPDKRKSAINEMVAGRVMHYAIVPLLGMAEDLQEEVLYFMLPYLEKYDLMKAIEKDVDNVKNRKPAELTAEERLKILYQIAAAMKFLHCPVEGLRGPIIHRDITTRNIVLDKDGNARLLDFGLSREFEEGQTRKTMTQSDMIGTPGYFVSSRMSDLNEKTDCLNFGVVILELLTGAKPVEGKNKQLCKTKLIDVKTNIKDYPIKNKGHITGVWGDDWLYVKELIQLAKKCLEQNITTSELFDTIKGLLSTGPFWTPSENISKCVICMVNPAAGRDVLNHSLGCNLHVCVACMRNSYLNPMHCHTCGNEVEPPIGKKWGALLIAGNDTKMKKCADIFSIEMLDAHDTFVSKHPLVMGIRKKHAYCIKPTKHGEPDTLKSKLQDSINELYEKGQHKTLDTLVFYFNGHCEAKGFLLGSDDEFITKEDLEKDLFQRLAGVGYTRFIVFLDCCTAPGFAVPELSKGNCIIQMNASRYLDITRVVDAFGSPFTQFLIAGLKGKALDKPCSNLRGLDIGSPLLDCKICEEYTKYHSDSLISVDKLFNFIHKHITAMGIHNLPTHFIANGNNENTKIAYFIDTPVKVTFDLQPYENSDQERTRRFELANLPKQFSELTQILLRQYKEEYHLPTGIDEAQHSGIISVSINTGPKEADVQELDTLEKIVVAWNGKQKLFVGLREIDNINKGKVGIILNGETRADQMLEMYIKCMDDCQIEKIKDEEIVRVRTEKLGNLHSDLCNFQSSDQASSVHLDYLKEHILCKLLIDQGIELQDSNKCLLMRFPEKMVNFLVLELEDVEATGTC